MSLSANPTRRRRRLYAGLGLTPQATDQELEATYEQLMEFLEDAPDGLRGWAENETTAAARAYARLSQPAGVEPAGSSRARRMLAGIAVVGVALAIAIGVYKMGDSGGEPGPQQAQATQAPSFNPVDQRRITRLMEKIKANPRDAETIVQIGDIFFRGGDYAAAGSWMARAVKADPRNATALVALGAAQFNLGGAADAQRQWLRAIEVDPDNVEAYYDLGFLYLSKQPPDVAKAKKLWRKVMEIAPNSSAAKTVATHLKRLDEGSAQAGAGSSGATPLAGGK